MSLLVGSPFSPFESFDRAFDQLTRSFLTAPRMPAVDVRAHDGGLELTVDLPGTPEDAIDVSVSGRMLTISVETDSLRWSRSLGLDGALDPDAVTATYVNGRLTVTVARAASAAPRRIAIGRTGPEALEAPSEETAQAAAATGTETTDNG